MSASDDTAEFIARQLNDHEDCDHGVRQGTYHTWKKTHILQAIEMACCYLFSIKPDSFADPVTFQTTQDSCIINTKAACAKPLSILSVGEGCGNVVEETEETNDLLSLMTDACTSDEALTSYTVEKKSDTVYVAGSVVPKGTSVTVLCAQPPSTDDDSADSILAEYKPLITAFACWWLLLTDNELRSNQARWQAYYMMVKDFVELKLLLEFSLNEDDYQYGRRRVND